MKLKLIERTDYIMEIKDVLQTPDIKVITGVRRSGKSKLLETIADYIDRADKYMYAEKEKYHQYIDSLEKPGK